MNDLIKKIEQLNQTKSFDDFENIGDEYVFFVDWREFDDAIVEYCEERIQTGHLSAEIIDETLSVNYKGKNYQTDITDSRDTSLIFINNILKPDFEIRFCPITFPSDTLGFIVLPQQAWQDIEASIPVEELNELFEPINDDTKMFNRVVIFNEAVAKHEWLADMYQDDYFPNYLVDKLKDILLDVCQIIEIQPPEDLPALYTLTNQAVAEINNLQDEFYENESEIETGAREAIGRDFRFIAKAYGYENADSEMLISERDW